MDFRYLWLAAIPLYFLFVLLFVFGAPMHRVPKKWEWVLAPLVFATLAPLYALCAICVAFIALFSCLRIIIAREGSMTSLLGDSPMPSQRTPGQPWEHLDKPPSELNHIGLADRGSGGDRSGG